MPSEDEDEWVTDELYIVCIFVYRLRAGHAYPDSGGVRYHNFDLVHSPPSERYMESSKD